MTSGHLLIHGGCADESTANLCQQWFGAGMAGMTSMLHTLFSRSTTVISHRSCRMSCRVRMRVMPATASGVNRSMMASVSVTSALQRQQKDLLVLQC